ncbi:hypothetical protein EVAR_4383_1 [Eumeta japonica]|uniref:Uncharacterized protein n=1 Tax=Eumeta variegata TaxID=151549 RepID=A0A4C1SXL5_EUMVA|nr:hypothetical protein EVAR_4383_1 [Eumeta japonica]
MRLFDTETQRLVVGDAAREPESMELYQLQLPPAESCGDVSAASNSGSAPASVFVCATAAPGAARMSARAQGKRGVWEEVSRVDRTEHRRGVD